MIVSKGLSSGTVAAAAALPAGATPAGTPGVSVVPLSIGTVLSNILFPSADSVSSSIGPGPLITVAAWGIVLIGGWFLFRKR